MQKIQQLQNIGFILLVTGLFVLIANVAGGHANIAVGPSIGVLILIAISFIGAILSMLPGLSKLPMVFWVSLVAIVCSLPAVPFSADLLAYTKQVNFLAITTPILAYGGLSLGRDIEAFRQLSWRIVPVALAVAGGSFLCATFVAEVMLHLEGIF